MSLLASPSACEESRSGALSAPRVLAIGLTGGVLSGLLGVGGGIVMVPLLVMLAGLDQRQAHAVSLGAIVPISVAGVATYGVSGHIDYALAAALAVGSIAGARIGAHLLVRTAESRLKIAFGVLLLAVAVTIGVGAR